MSGRRLLDAAAIYKASYGVASKYIALRKNQWENYSKTSSLVKAVRSQTDRITLTIKAASALSERFNNTSPTYSTQASQRSNPAPKDTIPRVENVQGVDQTIKKKQGLEQDHFYQRSVDNSAAEPSPESELSVKQEKAKIYALPDGLIPPADAVTKLQQQEVFSDVSRTKPPKSPLFEDEASHNTALEPVSSGRSSIPDPIEDVGKSPADRARELQRQAEKQIPSESADPPEIQGQDVFNSPSSKTSQSLSSLPRVKLPKVTEDRQGGHKSMHDGQINQDVFYSSIPKDPEHNVPEAQAVPKQGQFSGDMYSEIFQSPKVARMLAAKPKSGQKKEGLGLRIQQATTEQSKLLQGTNQESFSERPMGKASSLSTAHPDKSEESKAAKKADDEGIHQLTGDMANNSGSGPPAAAVVSPRNPLRVTHQLID